MFSFFLSWTALHSRDSLLFCTLLSDIFIRKISQHTAWWIFVFVACLFHVGAISNISTAHEIIHRKYRRNNFFSSLKVFIENFSTIFLVFINIFFYILVVRTIFGNYLVWNDFDQDSYTHVATKLVEWKKDNTLKPQTHWKLVLMGFH